MSLKICIICNRSFKSSVNIQKYCSNICARLKILRDKKIYRQNNAEKIRKYKRSYYESHKKMQAIKQQKYRQTHQSLINLYQKLRRVTNINFKISHYMRVRINQALRNNTKVMTTMKLVGCTIERLKQHLESQFDKGMSWRNYGRGYGNRKMREWHVDHIRPCASFDLSKEKEQKKCFHYTNLQPLWAKENREKYNKFGGIKWLKLK